MIPRKKVPQNEIDFIMRKAKGANVSGTTVPDIIKMAEDDEFSHFLAAKYPKLPTKVRYSRIRDIIRKQH